MGLSYGDLCQTHRGRVPEALRKGGAGHEATCRRRSICRAVGGTFLQTGGGTVTGVDHRQPPDRTPATCSSPWWEPGSTGTPTSTRPWTRGLPGCLCSRQPEATAARQVLYPGGRTPTLALRRSGRLVPQPVFHIPVVQVTGSAGKTTTKEMIASVLSRHFRTLKTEANLNNHIGTPQTLLRLEPCHQAAVIETGMDHFGQIRYLGEPGAAHHGRDHQRRRRPH